ncbi:MAG: hypothetical protein P4M11_12235 [Candidatus Pacebacteria bacterium]|nr:hypothetical protein [Candidatus Paceibacterota bacterium]
MHSRSSHSPFWLDRLQLQTPLVITTIITIIITRSKLFECK